MEWTKMPSGGQTPPGTFAMTMQYFDRQVFVVGGIRDDNTPMLGMFAYDFGSRLWRNVSSQRSYGNKSYVQSAAYGKYFYVLFGWDYGNGHASDEIMRVDLTDEAYDWELFLSCSVTLVVQ
jgi:hypothetical protein